MRIARPHTATRRRARRRWRRSLRAGGGSKRKPRACRGFEVDFDETPRGCPLDAPQYYSKAQIRQGADRDRSALTFEVLESGIEPTGGRQYASMGSARGRGV